MDKLPKTAAGAIILTLSTGKSADCVEHLPPKAYQKEGGDEVSLKLLDRRFPEKEKSDELGEMTHEICVLETQSAETVEGWIGLKKKIEVDFPEETRGWLALLGGSFCVSTYIYILYIYGT